MTYVKTELIGCFLDLIMYTWWLWHWRRPMTIKLCQVCLNIMTLLFQNSVLLSWDHHQIALFFCIFLRMTMRVALAPQAAVSQTAPRLWPSPAAFSRLPLVTQTCHQVSDGPGASKPLPPPRLENGNKGRNYLCGGGSRHGVRLRLVPFTLQKCFISCTEKSYRGKNLLI